MVGFIVSYIYVGYGHSQVYRGIKRMKKNFLSMNHNSIKESLVYKFTEALQENQRSLINIKEALNLDLIESDE